MWSWSLKLELSRVSRLFHASVTKFRKQTGYYGLRISCCHDFISSRALSISVHSPTQVPQMKPIVTLINEMPNLNIRDDLKFPHRVCGSNSTRFFHRTWLNGLEMTFNRNDLKIISNIQVVICGMLLTLGLVDGVSVRFVYSSLTFVPCWLAALVSKKYRVKKIVTSS